MKEVQIIDKAVRQKEKVKVITKKVNQTMKMKEKNTINNNIDNTKKNLKKYNLEISKAQEIIIWNLKSMNKKTMKVYLIVISRVKTINNSSKDQNKSNRIFKIKGKKITHSIKQLQTSIVKTNNLLNSQNLF